MTSSLSGAYWTSIIAGAADVLRGNGMTPVCVNLPPRATTEDGQLHPISALVSPEALAGMIVVTTAALEKTAAEFVAQRKGLASVCLGYFVEGIPSVWVRNAAGIRLLMTHLTQTCGRRRIAFIRGAEGSPEAEARFRAWEDFCTEHRLDHGSRLVEQGDFLERSGETATVRLLARTGSKQPDAIMAANDLMAIGALRALKARGLGVPQDVSVVGFDDIGADLADPPLTTVRQPLREMGARAAEVVYAQIVGKSVAAEHMFAPELIVRGSCRTESKQRPRCPQGKRSSIGAFIDRAYPSPDGALAAVWDELLGRHQGAQRTRHRVKLLLRLGELFKLAECRERALVEALMRPRAHAHRELLQVLASSKTWSEVRARAAAPLSLLGIDSLTVVALKNPPIYEGQAQVLLDFDRAGAAPIGADGAWLPARRLLVERTRRATGSLWVLKALEEDGPLGFVLLRGAVLDDAIVTELCGALARRVGRLDL